MESGDCKTLKSLCIKKAKRMSAGEKGNGRILKNFRRASFLIKRGQNDASQYCFIF